MVLVYFTHQNDQLFCLGKAVCLEDFSEIRLGLEATLSRGSNVGLEGSMLCCFLGPLKWKSPVSQNRHIRKSWHCDLACDQQSSVTDYYFSFANTDLYSILYMSTAKQSGRYFSCTYLFNNFWYLFLPFYIHYSKKKRCFLHSMFCLADLSSQTEISLTCYCPC